MVGLIALAATLLGLIAGAVVTARRPSAGVPDREGYLDRWQPLHGGVDPRANVFLRGWLSLGYVVARPLAVRGVHPDVLTVSSTWVAAAAVVVATYGDRWLILAGWLIVLSGLGDTLDGAVAVATGRTTRWGYVLDSAVDRVNDVLHLLAVWVIGGEVWVLLLAGVASFLLEYVRARGRNAGGTEVGVITVGERAVRVICCAVAVHFSGVLPGLTTLIVATSTGLLVLLSLVGLGQVAVAVRRDLQELPGSTPPA